jgi:hypothetical protein
MLLRLRTGIPKDLSGNEQGDAQALRGSAVPAVDTSQGTNYMMQPEIAPSVPRPRGSPR